MRWHRPGHRRPRRTRPATGPGSRPAAAAPAPRPPAPIARTTRTAHSPVLACSTAVAQYGSASLAACRVISIVATPAAAPAHRAALRSGPPRRRPPSDVHALTPPPSEGADQPGRDKHAERVARDQARRRGRRRAERAHRGGDEPFSPAEREVDEAELERDRRPGDGGEQQGRGRRRRRAARQQHRDEQAEPEQLGHGDDNEHRRPLAGRPAEVVGRTPGRRGEAPSQIAFMAHLPEESPSPAPAIYPLPVQLHQQNKLCWYGDGVQSVAELPFIAGHVALDFVNTAEGRGHADAGEALRTAADLRQWGERRGVIAASVSPTADRRRPMSSRPRSRPANCSTGSSSTGRATTARRRRTSPG